MNDDKTAAHPIKSILEYEDERQAFLIVLSGANIGKNHRLTEGLNGIGRSRKCEVVLEEDGVSRRHAEIEITSDGTALLADCGSTNGTYVDGRRLKAGERAALTDGARLMLGGSMVLRYSLQDQLDEKFQQKLYESAVRDGLTGAYNKGYILDRLDQEFSYSERHKTPLSLVVFDLDLFKRVNDTHGHDVGDIVLREVSKTILEAIRPEDVFARYGGEEFVLLMRESTLAHAMRTAERLRKAIEDLEIEVGAMEPLKITSSLGVASTDGGWHKNGRRLFVQADRNLYRAKQSGRNEVCGPERGETEGDE